MGLMDQLAEHENDTLVRCPWCENTMLVGATGVTNAGQCPPLRIVLLLMFSFWLGGLITGRCGGDTGRVCSSAPTLRWATFFYDRLPLDNMGLLDQADWGVFKRKDTWQAFAIAVVMFGAISFAALSMFDSMDELFQSNAEPAPVPNLVYESLNRSDVEAGYVNETGWFNLNDHRGSVIILDLMARDCSNCHLVQEHIENEMDDWQATAQANNKSLKIFAYGAWYSESVAYLNQSSGEYTVPLYPTGFGSTEAAVLDDGTTTDPVRLFTTGGTGQIPVVLILDEEGYIIAQQATGTPVDGWEKFDGLLNTALTEDISETFDSRIGWEEPETSFTAVFALGLILSILVYFSPCAFPVLPGFISYYLSLGAREDELIADGKLKTGMPSSFNIGVLSGLGMWTFFGIIGIVALLMGEAFASSGIIHYIAIFIALLLVVLGSMMLPGHHLARHGLRPKPRRQVQHHRGRRHVHATAQHVPLRHRLRCRID